MHFTVISAVEWCDEKLELLCIRLLTNQYSIAIPLCTQIVLRTRPVFRTFKSSEQRQHCEPWKTWSNWPPKNNTTVFLLKPCNFDFIFFSPIRAHNQLDSNKDLTSSQNKAHSSCCCWTRHPTAHSSPVTFHGSLCRCSLNAYLLGWVIGMKKLKARSVLFWWNHSCMCVCGGGVCGKWVAFLIFFQWGRCTSGFWVEWSISPTYCSLTSYCLWWEAILGKIFN